MKKNILILTLLIALTACNTQTPQKEEDISTPIEKVDLYTNEDLKEVDNSDNKINDKKEKEVKEDINSKKKTDKESNKKNKDSKDKTSKKKKNKKDNKNKDKKTEKVNSKKESKPNKKVSDNTTNKTDKKENTSELGNKVAYKPNNDTSYKTESKPSNKDTSYETVSSNTSYDTENKTNNNTSYKPANKPSNNTAPKRESKTVNNIIPKTETKPKNTTSKPSNNTSYKPKSKPKNNTTSKPKQEKPVVKEVSRTTVKETIPKSKREEYDYDKFEGSCSTYYGSDGYKEYEIIKYSDGTEKKNLINSKEAEDDVSVCGAKVKPHAYDYTTEWDGVYRPNQLVYNNRERFFTPYEAGYHDDIQAGINRNEVAAVTERTIDVNDGYSTYFSAHNTTIFEDIEKDLTIGDTILITDSYGNPGYYQVTDKYVYQRGEDKSKTPGYYYFYENTEEVIYLQTCVEGSATLLYIYTAVRV